jgi:hypothetical protein
MLDSTARNSRESPLLRLPGEIRNEIFSYVLGGKTLVAQWHFDPLLARVAGMTFTTRSALSIADPESDTSSSSDTGNVKSADLAILSVCRQSYHEARLLPMSSNIWLFHKVYSLHSETLSRLCDFQIRAITRVTIEEDFTWPDTVPRYVAAMKCKGMHFYDLFPGVRYVYFNVFASPPGDVIYGFIASNVVDESAQLGRLKTLEAWIREGSDRNLRIENSLKDDSDDEKKED